MIETVFPLDEYQSRVQKIREAMTGEGMRALLIYGRRQWYLDHYIRYVANYDTPGRPSLILLPLEDEPALLIGDEWDLERAREVTWIEDVRVATDLPSAAVDILTSRGLSSGKIGVAGAEGMGYAGLEVFPSNVYGAIRKAFPKMELDGASQIMDNIRAIRSPREIEVLRHASRLSDIGADIFYATVREGISERELWTEIWYAMESAGAQDVHCSMCRGPGSFWLHPATDHRLSKGDFVSVEFSPRYHGYFSQSNKMCIIGGMTREWEKLCRLAVEVRDASIALIRPGAVASTIVNEIVELVSGSQVGTMDMGGVHRLGHGSGPCLDEWPALTSKSETILQEGMSLAVHPIIYVPYIHSVLMLGEYVLVTRDGHEVLTTPQTEIFGV